MSNSDVLDMTPQEALAEMRRLHAEMQSWVESVKDKDVKSVEFVHDGKLYRGIAHCVGEAE